jgi:hypothetical protein
MKKVVKIKESELVNLIDRLIKENAQPSVNAGTQTANTGLDKAKGISTSDLGGQAFLNKAEPFIEQIAMLDDTKKAKAIGYIMSQIGLTDETFMKLKTKITTAINRNTPTA